MGNSIIFWAVLPGGRTNSVSTTNLVEARRRARDLGATNLFVFDVEKRESTKIF